MDNEKAYFSNDEIETAIEYFNAVNSKEVKVDLYNRLKTIWDQFMDGDFDLEDWVELYDAIANMHTDLYGVKPAETVRSGLPFWG